MREHGVTVWNSVPALMEMLVEYVAGRGERLRAVAAPGACCSGDWMPVACRISVASLAAAGRGASAWAARPRRRSGRSTTRSAKSTRTGTSIPYGRPMVEPEFHVLDDALEPRPVWVPGQLYIGGIGLAQGYWRDEVKTAASFITHPRTGERLYRTGDLGRYLPDGNIEFLGREDFQVKMQGYRIELGEIEAALAEHPRVRAAVVAVVGEPRGDKRLVAYVVAGGDEEPSTCGAAQLPQDKLPDYMVPAGLQLDALPLTPNGKVDREALPEMAKTLGQTGPHAQGGLPAGARRIGEVLTEFLRIEELEPEASLLELGASSVDIIRIANLLEKELGFRPQIDELYRDPTLRGLANACEQSSPDNAAAAPAPAPAVRGAGVDAIVASSGGGGPGRARRVQSGGRTCAPSKPAGRDRGCPRLRPTRRSRRSSPRGGRTAGSSVARSDSRSSRGCSAACAS